MSVARGHEVDGITWQLDRALACRLYALPAAPDPEGGGWTRFLARFAGR